MKTGSVRMPNFILQPGLKTCLRLHGSFSPFDWAEISSSVSQSGLQISAGAEIQPGMKLSSCNHKQLFKKICSGSRAEISARFAD